MKIKYRVPQSAQATFEEVLEIEDPIIKVDGQEIDKLVLDNNTIFDYTDHWGPFDNITYTGTARVNILGPTDYSFSIKFGLNEATSITAPRSSIKAVSTQITSNHIVITTTGYIYSSSYQIYSLYGDYNPTSGTLYNVGATGNADAEALLLNNGSITMTGTPNPAPVKPTPKVKQFITIKTDGDTNYIKNTFKRRLRENDSWHDDSDGDKLVSNTTEVHSGTNSIQVKGNASYPVSLAMKNDFTTAKYVERLSFWVYNPSNQDVSLRMWGYRGSNFQENYEFSPKIAYANQWTYCSTVQNTGAKYYIYNFQIADFYNSGVNLSFDDITLS